MGAVWMRVSPICSFWTKACRVSVTTGFESRCRRAETRVLWWLVLSASALSAAMMLSVVKWVGKKSQKTKAQKSVRYQSAVTQLMEQHTIAVV
eukprot:1949330-Amphidinium_carterae.1